MIYLASPYAHHDPVVMQFRYEQAAMYVSNSYKARIPMYSSIVHNHPIALLGGLPRTWEFWREIDLPMLRICDQLHILCLPGWKTSIGVTAEIDFAKSALIPITHQFVFFEGASYES